VFNIKYVIHSRHTDNVSSNNKTLNARLLARPRHKFVTGATLLQLK